MIFTAPGGPKEPYDPFSDNGSPLPRPLPPAIYSARERKPSATGSILAYRPEPQQKPPKRNFSSRAPSVMSEASDSSADEPIATSGTLDWSVAKVMKRRTMVFPALQERIYHEEHLAPSAQVTLFAGHSLGLVIMLGELIMVFFGENDTASLIASIMGIVFNMVGLFVVTFRGGTFFTSRYIPPFSNRKQETTMIATGPTSPNLPLHQIGSPSSAVQSPDNAFTETSSRKMTRSRRSCWNVDYRYLLLTPLALYFLSVVARVDIRSADNSYTVTGSSLPYVLLLTSAALGLAFTYPTVWFPLSAAFLIVTLRCVLIGVATTSVMTGNSINLPYRVVPPGGIVSPVPTTEPTKIANVVAFADQQISTLLPTIAPNPDVDRDPFLLIKRQEASVSGDLSPSLADATQTVADSIDQTATAIQTVPSESIDESATSTHTGSTNSIDNAATATQTDSSTPSLFGSQNLDDDAQKVPFAHATSQVPADPAAKHSVITIILAVLAGVLAYLTPSMIASALSIRFGVNNERDNRIRFLQTKVIQTDRDRLTRERDRSARLLSIVFPKPVISRLLGLRNTLKVKDEIERSERALLGNMYESEDPDPDGDDEGGSSASGPEIGLEFADRIANAVVGFIDFYPGDFLAGIDGDCVHSRLHAKRSVMLMNMTFEKFDSIIERHPGIDKIKTIGTKVMVAAGLFDSDTYKSSAVPTKYTISRSDTTATTATESSVAPNSETAAAERTLLLLRVALEAMQSMKYYEASELEEVELADNGQRHPGPCTCPIGRKLDDARPRQIRIGAATGTVVAGIVGLERFCLDLWGDAVNTASRMLSASAENEIVVTEDIKDGIQRLRKGKVSKVLGMISKKDDLQFRSLGTREIKGKGAMQLFVVTNSGETIPNLAGQNRKNKGTNRMYHGGGLRRQPTKYGAATAELAAAARELAKDAEAGDDKNGKADDKDGDDRRGSGRIPSFWRRSVEGLTSDIRRTSAIAHKSIMQIGSGRGSHPYVDLPSPSVVSPIPTVVRKKTAMRRGRARAATVGSESPRPQLTGQSITAFDGRSTLERNGRISPEVSTPTDDEQIYPVDTSTGPIENDQGRRISMVISNLVPHSTAASESDIIEAYSRAEAIRSHKAIVGVVEPLPSANPAGGMLETSHQPNRSVYSLMTGVIDDFLSTPASELSHGRQHQKLASHLNRWQVSFKDTRIEKWYRSAMRARADTERNALRFIFDGCVANFIAIVAAGLEIYFGSPASFDVRGNPVAPKPPSAASAGFWFAVIAFIVHLNLAFLVQWRMDARDRRVADKKRKRRQARVVANENAGAGDLSEQYARFQEQMANGATAAAAAAGPAQNARKGSVFSLAQPFRRGASTKGDRREGTPLVYIGSSSQQSSSDPLSTQSPALDIPNDAADKTTIAPTLTTKSHAGTLTAYHVSTLAFFLCFDLLLYFTPMGDRFWVAPSLQVSATFYSIYLDIGTPSVLRVSLWTALLLVSSSFVLLLGDSLTAVELLVVLSFGYAAFVMLIRTTQRAKRTGFLLQAILDRQKSMSASEGRRSAQLLMSILPKRILMRVIDDPRLMIVEEFSAVTFLHLDVVEFTAMSAALTPEAVVALLNVLFTQFDNVCRKYGVEKMTTIGDAYVAFGVSSAATHAAESGIEQDDDEEMYLPSALATCKAAVELQAVVATFNRSDFASSLLRPSGRNGVVVRVAVHTGKGHGCVLGGATRLKYEFIGDALRLAEKFEERCPRGEAAVSEATVRRLGREGYDVLRNGHGVVDGIRMDLLPQAVDGLRCYVMSRE